jgi:uncharacterized protein (DUF1330 family)
MAACLIGSLDITDLAGFAGNARQAPAVIAPYGGRYPIRGGAAAWSRARARYTVRWFSISPTWRR